MIMKLKALQNQTLILEKHDEKHDNEIKTIKTQDETNKNISKYLKSSKKQLKRNKKQLKRQ